MKRYISDEILTYLREGTQGILVYGTPCIGKSYVLQEVSSAFEKSYLFCDLKIDVAFLKGLLAIENDADDALLKYLCDFFSLDANVLSNTLIVFDGVEVMKENVALLYRYKLPTYFLASTSRIDYIAQIPMLLEECPIRPIKMQPMSFYEFLEANERQWLLTIIRGHAHNRESIPEIISGELQELFSDYLLVGGYPQAVLQYQNNRADLAAIRTVHEQIYATIRLRYTEHLPEHISQHKIAQLMQYISTYGRSTEIPFRASYIRKGAVLDEFVNELQFLEVNGVLQVIYENGKLFRFEPRDCGIFRFLCNDYEFFYALDEEECGLPMHFYQNYLYGELTRRGLQVQSLHFGRTGYIPYYVPDTIAIFVSNGKKRALHNISALKIQNPKVTLYNLQCNPYAQKKADHNIQYYSLEATQFF